MGFPDFYSQGPAPCTRVDPEQFFSDSDLPHSGTITTEAKKVCVGCPYITACLEWAIATNEPGVWGGVTQTERKRIKAKRRKDAQKISA